MHARPASRGGRFDRHCRDGGGDVRRRSAEELRGWNFHPMKANTPHCSCSCNEISGPAALVYSCSGAADTGEIADRVARRLDVEDVAWMSCLAGIGGRVSGPMASAAAAHSILALDGCPQDCAKKALRRAGFSEVKHLRVTDLGFKKGQSPATEETVRQVVAAAAAIMLRSCARPS